MTINLILNHLFNPSGKLNRKEFIIGNIAWIILVCLSCFLFILIRPLAILALLLLYPFYLLAIKRLRDAGLSLWLVIAYIIPAFIIPMMIFLAIYKHRR
jgi:uncharacterized membrane protein YhaH (DUF805 family)